MKGYKCAAQLLRILLRTKFVNKGKKKRKGREGERYSGPLTECEAPAA
jgi:hypothetical protein